ncbi:MULTISPECIES: HAD family phosphatase [unclassified Paludibacterium]|uniref:HAD family hydrolase n=1 Tax=unclassified Paludibacterium TaxID=2618429 RepID=UPI001C045A85|nr:HAD-IA family hydrolase [Paludibacterium sp. B53371]BEV71585.1 HAD family hydrolase [Paludibacterium sp. THUN1379]
MTSLLILDCDGVLVDSERITHQVFADMLNELGLAVTLEYLLEHFIGLSMPQCLARVAEMLGHPPPPDFVEHYRLRSQLALQAGVRPVEGVVEALDQIEVTQCVASNGSYGRMRTTLGLAGLLLRFERSLFSGCDIAQPKPAPDLYLQVARQFGVAPQDCIVVEGTPSGVMAGQAAGMTVLGYAGLIPAHRLQAAGAHQVLHHMQALPSLVAALKAQAA